MRIPTVVGFLKPEISTCTNLELHTLFTQSEFSRPKLRLELKQTIF